MIAAAPRVGAILERDGRRWRIVDVWPRLTPFRRADQDTRIEGYTLGLREFRRRARRSRSV